MLFVDLYELTMMQAYFIYGYNETAVFDFYIRKRKGIPRNFFVFAGLEYLLEFISNLKFSESDLEYLDSLKIFKKEFLDYLKDFRFEGDIYSVEEGRIVFPDEPLVEVVADLTQAQFLETALINLVQFSTLVATKSARCFAVAGGRILVDFGARRAHSFQSAEAAARASFITGFAGTSLVYAGKKYGIPVYGTMAHSYVMIFDDEKEAFEKFSRMYPGTILLVDTYSTEKGIKNAISVLKKLREEGINIKGIRIDSGDVVKLSKYAREIFKKEGLEDLIIFLSGAINEYKIKEIIDSNGEVDGFGVGSELTVSADMPYLDCAYKLVEYGGKPKMKLSEGKKTIPSRKSLIRLYKNSMMVADVITPFGYEEEAIRNKDMIRYDQSELILKKVCSKGKILDDICLKDKKQYILTCRDRFLKDFSYLPDEFKNIYHSREYPVIFSSSIRKITEDLEANLRME